MDGSMQMLSCRWLLHSSPIRFDSIRFAVVCVSFGSSLNTTRSSNYYSVGAMALLRCLAQSLALAIVKLTIFSNNLRHRYISNLRR
jgi:hypothetical protein